MSLFTTWVFENVLSSASEGAVEARSGVGVSEIVQAVAWVRVERGERQQNMPIAVNII